MLKAPILEEFPLECLEQEIDRIDCPSWLAGQQGFPKFYSKCPTTSIETIAVGSLKYFSDIPSKIPDFCTLFGYLSFPGVRKTSFWKDFPDRLFFLPKIEVYQSPSKTVLKIRDPHYPILPAKPLTSCLLSENLLHTPSYLDWEDSVKKILNSIEQGDLQKAVLARKTTFLGQIDPFALLKKLILQSHNSTVFALQLEPSSLFLGATPEKLYQRKHSLLFTESVAGTRKRGASLEEEKQLGLELQASLKDQEEFSYVRDFIGSKLASLSQSFTSKESPSLLQTAHLQHLYSSFNAVLKPNVTDLEISSTLHPTPAVGGFPRNKALKLLSDLESFDRGLYAGALGYLSSEESSFVVGIRSALATASSLHAFAGTGIVKGSDPLQEWMELEGKISHWKSI
jgi:menaquinone-specific isochorismate synthase